MNRKKKKKIRIKIKEECGECMEIGRRVRERRCGGGGGKRLKPG